MKLFLLSGFGGVHGDWSEFVRGLGTRHKCVSVVYPETKLVGAVAELLAAETEPYAVVGYSMGGRIALAATSALPKEQSPRALVLLASGLNEQDAAIRQQRLQQDEAWASLLRRDAASFWGDWYAQPIFSSLKEVPTEALLAWHERRKALSPEVLASQIIENSPGKMEPLRPRLRALIEDGISVLYISGELDKKYSSLGEELAGEYLMLERATIPGVGHVLPLEAPLECAAIVENFLKKQEK